MKRKAVKNAPPKKRTEQPSANLLPAILVTLVFSALALIGILHHEMWRDELQPWLVVRDAHSFSDLFRNMKYEGHPPLWYFLLFIVSAFTSSPVAMQMLHLLIAAAFVFILNCYSPFPLVQRIILSFGYFSIYEYCIVSRCYGLGFLLLLIFCLLYEKRFQKISVLGGVLCLLTNASPYGIVIATGCAGLLLLDFFFNKESWKSVSLGKATLGGIIFLCGLALALCSIVSPKDSTGSQPMYDQLKNPDIIKYVVSKIFAAYTLIPEMSSLPQKWSVYGRESTNGNILQSLTPNLFFSLGLLFVFALSFSRKLPLLLFYLGTTFVLLILLSLSPRTSVRYIGNLYLVLLAACWLSHYYKQNTSTQKSGFLSGRIPKQVAGGVFWFMIVCQVYPGVMMYLSDLKHPFSASLETAAYIKEQKLDSLPVLGSFDFATSPLTAYLNKPIYYSERQDFGTFVIWDGNRSTPPDWDLILKDMVKAADSLLGSSNKKILLALSWSLKFSEPVQEGMLAPTIKVTVLKSFEQSIVSDEKYYLYLAERI